ncbi:MAG: PAS domain S-box protein [Anaerolineae bacterium]
MNRWFRFPAFDDLEKTRDVRMLMLITALIIGVTLVFEVVLTLFFYNPRTSVLVAVVALLTGIAHLLARRGYLRAGILLLCVVTWTALTVAAGFDGGRGVYDIAFNIYIVPILLVSFLIGGPAGMALAIVSSLSGFIMLLTIPVLTREINDAVLYWAANSVLFGFTATLMWIYERRVRKARVRTQRREVQLEEQSGELKREIAERSHFEDAYRTVVENSLQGLAISQQGKIVFANSAMAQMLGYSVEELYAVENISQLVYPSDRDQLRIPLDNDLHDIVIPNRYEVRAVHRTGEIRWLETFPVSITYQGLPAIQYAVMDISERRKAEEALREREAAAADFQEKLKALHTISIELSSIESFDDLCCRAVELGRGQFGFDRLGLLLYDEQNHKMLGTFGTDAQGKLRDERGLSGDILPEPWVLDVKRQHETVYYQEDTILYDNWQPVGRGWNALAILWAGDITIGWLAADNLVHQQPLKPYELELLRLYGLALGNILGRRRTEEALKRSQEWFSHIFRSSPVSISMSNVSDAKYVDVNPRWCELFGYSRDEAIGHSGIELGLWPSLDQREQLAQRIAQEGHLHQIEAQLKDRHGAIRHTIMSSEMVELHGQMLYLTMTYDITERMEAERALQRSQEWFATVFRAAPVCMSITATEDGGYVDVNPSWCEFFGYSREEALGQKGVELNLWSSNHRAEFMRLITEYGRIHQQEFVVNHRDGRPRSVILSSEIVELNGKPHYLTMVSDVTEHKRAEAALREREEHAHEFQEKLKALQSVSLELAEVGSIDEMGRRAVELGRDRLGYDRIGLMLFHTGTRSVVNRYGIKSDDTLHIEQNLSYNVEDDPRTAPLLANRDAIYVNEDADLLDFNQVAGHGWNVATGIWDGNTSIGWVAADNLFNHKALVPYQIELLRLYGLTLGHLMTRKRTEEELKRSQEWFARIFQMAPFGITIRAVNDGRFVDVNEASIRMFGFDRDEIIGHSSIELQTWADEKARAERFEQLAREGRLDQVEVQVHGRNDTIRTVLLSTQLIDFHGEPHYLSTIADITERKQLEQQRLELALANERLELFREFMTNISHDLKTPLAVINTSVELMERIKDPERQKEKMASIKEQTARLDKYIYDMLTISRLDHAPDLLLRSVDANRIISDVYERLYSTAEKKEVRIIREPSSEPPNVLADESELDRMMVNLLENALNYTPAGGTIWIRSYVIEDNVQIDVTDTGIGIGEKDLVRIFDRFYRADTARSTKISGTGLGLAIVRRIVEMHGGSISVESQLGVGTTFRVLLPLAENTDIG